MHGRTTIKKKGSKCFLSVRELYNKTEITFSEVFKRDVRVCVCVWVCGVGRAHVQSNNIELNDL
jgi:hypothetical protein